jgi:uncharacterized protein (UPF0262 family)
MALRIINVELLNSFVKEIKEVDAEYKVYIVLVDLFEKREDRLEINKENECAIQEFFEEKFYQNTEQHRYGYKISLRLMSATPIVEGVDYQELLKLKIESVNKIKQKYVL